MHEYAIGERILNGVLEELGRVRPPPQRVNKARVVAGALHQIVPNYLTFAYELLSRDTAAAGSTLELVIAPVVAGCPACGWEGEIKVPFFQCGRCAGLGVNMKSGDELYLDGLEVETDEHKRN